MKLFCVIELREDRLVYVLLTLSQEGRNLKSSSLHLSVLSSTCRQASVQCFGAEWAFETYDKGKQTTQCCCLALRLYIVRLAELIRCSVRWRAEVFKIPGFVCKRFLPSPPHPPSFIFWLSFHFSRGQNQKNPVPLSFFALKPNGNACCADYI